jgi:hypothetical protein
MSQLFAGNQGRRLFYVLVWHHHCTVILLRLRMKTQRFIAAIALCGLFSQLAVGLNSAPANAAQGKDERGGRSVPREKGHDDSDAQWSADPDRGWIRTDERNKAEKKESPKPKPPSGKNKDDRRK